MVDVINECPFINSLQEVEKTNLPAKNQRPFQSENCSWKVHFVTCQWTQIDEDSYCLKSLQTKTRLVKGLLFIWTSVWVLQAPKFGQNMPFQCFLCKKAETRKKIETKFSKKMGFWVSTQTLFSYVHSLMSYEDLCATMFFWEKC